MKVKIEIIFKEAEEIKPQKPIVKRRKLIRNDEVVTDLSVLISKLFEQECIAKKHHELFNNVLSYIETGNAYKWITQVHCKMYQGLFTKNLQNRHKDCERARFIIAGWEAWLSEHPRPTLNDSKNALELIIKLMPKHLK